MASPDWHPDLVRAALPQAVLTFLSHGPRHGYQLRDELREVGFVRIRGGTLYPMLSRLEEQGIVSHHWEHEGAGPARKIFNLTAAGRTELDRSTTAWQAMTDILHSIRTRKVAHP